MSTVIGPPISSAAWARGLGHEQSGRFRRDWPDKRPGMGWRAGPAIFIADWALLGATKRGYSPVQDAISRLAEMGASTCVPMTGGFIIYGLGLTSYGLALRRQHPGAAGTCAMATGLATLGVAAFPLGTPSSDAAHAVFAGLGYATLAAVPIAASRRLMAAGHPRLARVSMVTGLTTGALLLVSAIVSPAHGLTQRAGLTLGDTWALVSALAMLRNSRPGGLRSRH